MVVRVLVAAVLWRWQCKRQWVAVPVVVLVVVLVLVVGLVVQVAQLPVWLLWGQQRCERGWQCKWQWVAVPVVVLVVVLVLVVGLVVQVAQLPMWLLVVWCLVQELLLVLRQPVAPTLCGSQGGACWHTPSSAPSPPR